jgi:hypothetical protein
VNDVSYLTTGSKKGFTAKHAARLNLGDCCAYAPAKALANRFCSRAMLSCTRILQPLFSLVNYLV